MTVSLSISSLMGVLQFPTHANSQMRFPRLFFLGRCFRLTTFLEKIDEQVSDSSTRPFSTLFPANI